MARWLPCPPPGCSSSTSHACSAGAPSACPRGARHQVQVDCDLAPRHLTIVERRAPWREDHGSEWTRLPIARLRYTKASKTWTLYWRGCNLRFHAYHRIGPSTSINDLLAEIDRDPTGVPGGRRVSAGGARSAAHRPRGGERFAPARRSRRWRGCPSRGGKRRWPR
ncbi:MAG: DUF3024 domain-containing protein [Pseudonocardiaceae bacterium]